MGKKKNTIPRDIDLVTKKTEDKNRWKWVVRIDRLSYKYDSNGVPQILGYTVLPEFLYLTTTGKEQEFELIDTLTTDRGNFGAPSETKLYKALKEHPDQLYRLTIFKQSVTSKVLGVEDVYGMWGWCLISKNKDKILWETQFFQNGKLFDWNVQQRDPIEDFRRKHKNEIPSGGIDYKW